MVSDDHPDHKPIVALDIRAVSELYHFTVTSPDVVIEPQRYAQQYENSMMMHSMPCIWKEWFSTVVCTDVITVLPQKNKVIVYSKYAKYVVHGILP